MAKRTSNRSTAEDSGATAAPPQPRSRRSRAAATPAAPEADTIGAAAGVQGMEHAQAQNNAAGIPSEAGDDAPLEQMSNAHESTSMGSEPSEDDIRVRAYHRYLERGGGHGQDFEDWLEAERELKSR
jgi:hypothetical protein